MLVLPLQDTLGPHQRTHSPDSRHLSSLRGTGWGCHQASELVLNNLLFLTIEHSLEFPLEVEALWGSLCGWTHNVGYIYSYLLQVIGLGLTPRLLYYAKSILCYLARTCPSSVIGLLLRELSSVEIISGYLEPISPPPYFQVGTLVPLIRCYSVSLGSPRKALSPQHNPDTVRHTRVPQRHPPQVQVPIGPPGGHGALRVPSPPLRLEECLGVRADPPVPVPVYRGGGHNGPQREALREQGPLAEESGNGVQSREANKHIPDRLAH